MELTIQNDSDLLAVASREYIVQECRLSRTEITFDWARVSNMFSNAGPSNVVRSS